MQQQQQQHTNGDIDGYSSGANDDETLSLEDKFLLIRQHEKKLNENFKEQLLKERAHKALKDSVRDIRTLKKNLVQTDYSRDEFTKILNEQYAQKVNTILEKQYIYWQVCSSATIPTFRLSELPGMQKIECETEEKEPASSPQNKQPPGGQPAEPTASDSGEESSSDEEEEEEEEERMESNDHEHANQHAPADTETSVKAPSRAGSPDKTHTDGESSSGDEEGDTEEEEDAMEDDSHKQNISTNQKTSVPEGAPSNTHTTSSHGTDGESSSGDEEEDSMEEDDDAHMQDMANKQTPSATEDSVKPPKEPTTSNLKEAISSDDEEEENVEHKQNTTNQQSPVSKNPVKALSRSNSPTRDNLKEDSESEDESMEHSGEDEEDSESEEEQQKTVSKSAVPTKILRRPSEDSSDSESSDEESPRKKPTVAIPSSTTAKQSKPRIELSEDEIRNIGVGSIDFSSDEDESASEHSSDESSPGHAKRQLAPLKKKTSSTDQLDASAKPRAAAQFSEDEDSSILSDDAKDQSPAPQKKPLSANADNFISSSDDDSLMEDEEEADSDAESFISGSTEESSVESEHNDKQRSLKRKRSPSPDNKLKKRVKHSASEESLSVDMDDLSEESGDEEDSEDSLNQDGDGFVVETSAEVPNDNTSYSEEVLSVDEMDEKKVKEIRNADIVSVSSHESEIEPLRKNRKKRQTKLFTSTPKKPLDPAARRKKAEKEAKKFAELQKRRQKLLRNMNSGAITKEMRVVNPQAPEGKHIYIPEELFQFLKPHQVEGIQFMWDRICEKENKERGVILAHSMGLGKTLQAVTFIQMCLLNNKASHVLVACPKSVIENWRDEFMKWLGDESPPLYMFESSNIEERIYEMEAFEGNGGVFIASHNMIGRLLSPAAKRPNYKDQSKMESYDELQKKAKKIFVEMVNACVVDEGHMITKEKNHLTRGLTTLKTRNRIVLTGTPLQNHLKEMYQVINWVRPQHWSQEFFNGFYANPIKDGMKKDSSAYEVGLMKRRSFLLIKKLKAFVDRKNVDILKQELPPKTELVIGCRMTDFQRDLYASFLRCNRDGADVQGQLFFMWHTIMKIVNHPDIVRDFMKRKNIRPNAAQTADTTHDYSWASPLFEPDYKPFMAERSTKLKMALQIIESCINQGEKILVFSQFTDTLTLIEHVLASTTLNINGREKTLKKGVDWYRLDGSSSQKKRHQMITDFNSNKKVSIFFISTKAGGMGINLTGATRILIYDVLWNPMWNSQALFRSFRYGQKKNVFVYRLCTVDCIEEVLWSRCTAKSWLFEKVVNDSNPTRSITFADLELRPQIEETEKRNFKKEDFQHDTVFTDAYNKMKRIIRDVYSYDSLYEEDLDDKLTDEERRHAEAEERAAKGREQAPIYIEHAKPTVSEDPARPVMSSLSGPNNKKPFFLKELMDGEMDRMKITKNNSLAKKMSSEHNHRTQIPMPPMQGSNFSRVPNSPFNHTANGSFAPYAPFQSNYQKMLNIQASGTGGNSAQISQVNNALRNSNNVSNNMSISANRNVYHPTNTSNNTTRPSPTTHRMPSHSYSYTPGRHSFNGVPSTMQINSNRVRAGLSAFPPVGAQNGRNASPARLSQPTVPAGKRRIVIPGPQAQQGRRSNAPIPQKKPSRQNGPSMQDLIDQFTFATDKEKKELLSKHPGLSKHVGK